MKREKVKTARIVEVGWGEVAEASEFDGSPFFSLTISEQRQERQLAFHIDQLAWLIVNLVGIQREILMTQSQETD